MVLCTGHCSGNSSCVCAHMPQHVRSVTRLCAQAKAQEVRNNKDYAETPWGEESEALEFLKRDSAAATPVPPKEGGPVNGPPAGSSSAPSSMKGKARTTRCMGSTMGMKVGCKPLKTKDRFCTGVHMGWGLGDCWGTGGIGGLLIGRAVSNPLRARARRCTVYGLNVGR